ncbi:Uncharacterised protein [Raoultella terrigena]|nr:Uncharacterised protein [Raoultella terrigena]
MGFLGCFNRVKTYRDLAHLLCLHKNINYYFSEDLPHSVMSFFLIFIKNSHDVFYRNLI